MPTALPSTRTVRAAIGELPARPIDSLTSLRGLLALWVAFYHFWKDAVALFPSADVATPVVAQGHFAVPVFFVLSGFVLAYNYASNLSALGAREYGRFLFLRAARIYPVHLACLLAVLGMVCVCRIKGWPLTDAGYGRRDFVLNLLLAQTWVPHFHLNWNYPSWSISSEWFAYLLFPLLCAAVFRRINTRFQAHIFLGVCWVATIALYAFGDELPFRELLWVVPTFLAGAAMFACRSCSPSRMPLQCRYVPDLLLLVLAAVPLVTSGRVMIGLLLSGFLALVYLLAFEGDNCSRLWTNRFAIFLGEISYSLYMAHTLAQKVCYKLLPAERLAGSHIITRVVVVLLYIGAIAIASLGMYYLIERPSRRRLRKWTSRPNHAPNSAQCKRRERRADSILIHHSF
ncbi:MAG TPA: acyltransferase [Gemmataceae bacterium]|jgi:peptidoglycan/LPS O-acetylase OafA/YrhL